MLLINLAISFLKMVKVKSLECMSVVNQKCMSRSKIININANEPIFYPYSIKVNKCSVSCNNINDPFAKLCVPGITKNINVKVFNIMARINEIRQIVWHETCKCICKLTSAVCNIRQIWNEDKCRYECDIGQYRDYKNCVGRKSLVDKLVEECINVIDGGTMYNETLSIDPNDCPSCTPYVALFILFLSISIVVRSTFIYFHWYKNKRSEPKRFL